MLFAYMYIFFYFDINGTPIIDFQFSLLAPISKRGSRTSLDDDGDDDDDDNYDDDDGDGDGDGDGDDDDDGGGGDDDDDDDEWIMFQLCTDAKS